MCDTIAAAGASTLKGTVLFGKNSDRDSREAQYLQLIPGARHGPGSKVRLTYKTIDQASETHAVLLSKPHWIWGAEIGANAHGLVIGNEAIFSKIEAPFSDGIIGMDYVRLGLERARSVDEAIRVITTLLGQHGQAGNCGFTRQVSYHNSFMLADFDCVKVLETVGRDWVVLPVTGHYAISNAMTIGRDFQSSSPTLRLHAQQAGLYREGDDFAFDSIFEDASRTMSGRYRRQRAMELLGERSGALRITDFFGILRDHQEGMSREGRPTVRICAHRADNPIGQTTAAWVADLTPGKVVHWVTGTSAPCSSLFKPVLFESGLPEHGSRPGSVEDTTSLWWRHEQLRRALDRSSKGYRDAFDKERSELEMSFVSQMASCPGVTDLPGRSEARRLVQRCWHEALDFESRWYARLVS